MDLDTGQLLWVVDDWDHTGVGAWLLLRPLQLRLGVQVVAIDPSAAFRKALRMWLPRTVVSIDHFHLSQLVNHAFTEVPGRAGRPCIRLGRTGCCYFAPLIHFRTTPGPVGDSLRYG